MLNYFINIVHLTGCLLFSVWYHLAHQFAALSLSDDGSWLVQQVSPPATAGKSLIFYIPRELQPLFHTSRNSTSSGLWEFYF